MPNLVDRYAKLAHHLIERREAGERWAVMVELTPDSTAGEIRYLLAQTMRKPGVLRVGAANIDDAEHRQVDDMPDPGINGYDHGVDVE